MVAELGGGAFGAMDGGGIAGRGAPAGEVAAACAVTLEAEHARAEPPAGQQADEQRNEG